MPPKKKANPKTVQPWKFREQWVKAIREWRDATGYTNSDLARAIRKSLSHLSATISRYRFPAETGNFFAPKNISLES